MSKLAVDYTNKADLQLLVDNMQDCPLNIKNEISASCLQLGLMVPGNLILRVVTAMCGPTRKYVVWKRILDKSEVEGTNFFKQTCEHILNGKDAVDPKSAGGFNKIEMAMFLKLLELKGFFFDVETVDKT